MVCWHDDSCPFSCGCCDGGRTLQEEDPHLGTTERLPPFRTKDSFWCLDRGKQWLWMPLPMLFWLLWLLLYLVMMVVVVHSFVLCAVAPNQLQNRRRHNTQAGLLE